MCKLTAHSNSYICNFPLVNSKSEGDLKFGHLGLVSMSPLVHVLGLDEVQRVCDMWQLVVVLFILILLFLIQVFFYCFLY